MVGDAGTLIYYEDGDSGFIYRGSRGINNRTCVDGAMDFHLLYDASRCSSEYVTGANLQPSALQVLCCIKA